MVGISLERNLDGERSEAESEKETQKIYIQEERVRRAGRGRGETFNHILKCFFSHDKQLSVLVLCNVVTIILMML